VLQKHNSDLYNEIYDWVMENHRKPEMKEVQVFGKYAKFALKEFFDEIYAMSPEMEQALENEAYTHAKKFFKAFKSEGYASKVRELL